MNVSNEILRYYRERNTNSMIYPTPLCDVNKDYGTKHCYLHI